MRRKRPTTAAQLLSELEADPEFMRRQAQDDAENERRSLELARAEAPLLADLARAGRAVVSVWDLVNTREPYPEAIGVLLDHLERSYPEPVRDGIARALAVREARFAWGRLVHLFRREKNGQVKDGLAVAISAMADAEVIDDVIDLATDQRQGPARVLLLRALGRSSDPRAEAALTKLAKDGEVGPEARLLLKRRKNRPGPIYGRPKKAPPRIPVARKRKLRLK